MSLQPGARLGAYELISLLGKGGMGEVYRAYDSRLGRNVAIKVLAGQLAGDPNFQDRFEREARTLSRLVHPNICTVHDVGSDADTRYLVMEYLEGSTLARALKSGPLPIDRALDYAIQIADGLKKAHALGVIHRDLKPSNVIVTSDDLVKILDFGLAKQHRAAETDATAVAPMTDVGLVMGTVAYMAPEQTANGQVDARTDVFAFGVMLYEMFCGTNPFDGGNIVSTIRRLNDVNPPSLRSLRSDIPAAVESIILKALEKDPRRRFQTISEMRVALREAAGRSLSGAADSQLWNMRPAGSLAWPRRTALFAAVAVSVVVVGGLAWRFAPSWIPNSSDSASAGSLTTFVDNDPTALARRGQALLSRHDKPSNVDEAIQAFKNALAVAPESALAHAGIAEAYIRKDSATPDPQWKRLASEHARRAVQSNPDLAVSNLAHGFVLLRLGQRDEAEKALLKARDLDPRNAAVMWLLGQHLEPNDPAKAEGAYRTAVDLAPDDWRSHVALGQFYFKTARYQDAIAAWERARDLTPDNVIVLRNLGSAYHMVERVDEAAATFQRALEIQPSATTYSNVGTLRFFQGRYADAVAAFEKAVELNPTYYLYWGNLGDAYRWTPAAEEKAGEAFTRATTLVEEALRANPQNVDLRSSLAGYLAKRNQAAPALEQVRLIEQVDKRTPGSYFKTAVVYEITGRRELALRDLEAALKSGYSLREVANEAELLKLRSDARYHRMLARLGH